MVEPSATTRITPGRKGWGDLLASVVVFMVGLPLCIGIAAACGLPPEAGVVSGVIGGILVGVLSGSPLQVSGPAAGLIVLVIQFFDEAEAGGLTGPAAISAFGLTVALAGGMQILAGVLRLGQWFRAVSPAVVGGMLAGIGITIIAKQFHELVDDKAPKAVVDGLLTIPEAVAKAVSPRDGATADHNSAGLIGLLTILTLAVWRPLAPLRLRIIPAAVVGVGLAVAVAELADLRITRVSLSGRLIDAFRPIAWPGWEVVLLPLVWKSAVTFALIASAETLLCAVAVDGMHSGPRTRFNRELIAQGVGNAACGLVGALPMTGVIVRSAANVEAGAQTRLSTILHGVWLLLFVALLPDLLSLIPNAALAAVLVYTGWKLVNVAGMRQLWRIGPGSLANHIVTAGAIVVSDLLTGVLIGSGFAVARLVWMLSDCHVDCHHDPEHRRIDCTITGAATFLRLPQIATSLERLPPGQKLHIHLDGIQFVDHAVLELIMTFQRQYEATGGTVYLDWERLRAHFHAVPSRGRRSQGRGQVRPPSPTAGPPTDHTPTSRSTPTLAGPDDAPGT